MLVLNLYAGLGGNRSGWPNSHHVTSIERDRDILEIYRKLYPNDIALDCDCLEYLESSFSAYDFIWASPPCQSHGQYRHNVGVIGKGYKPITPDMSLYGIIVFLKAYHKGLWAVENTQPYYEPLIQPTAIVGRHLIWSNFPISGLKLPASDIRSKNKIGDFGQLGELVAASNIPNKRQALRNMTDPMVGKHVWDAMIAAKGGPR